MCSMMEMMEDYVHDLQQQLNKTDDHITSAVTLVTDDVTVNVDTINNASHDIQYKVKQVSVELTACASCELFYVYR